MDVGIYLEFIKCPEFIWFAKYMIGDLSSEGSLHYILNSKCKIRKLKRKILKVEISLFKVQINFVLFCF